MGPWTPKARRPKVTTAHELQEVLPDFSGVSDIELSFDTGSFGGLSRRSASGITGYLAPKFLFGREGAPVGFVTIGVRRIME